jgi:hypothetical protein
MFKTAIQQDGIGRNTYGANVTCVEMDCGQLETGIVYSLTYEIALGALRA